MVNQNEECSMKETTGFTVSGFLYIQPHLCGSNPYDLQNVPFV